MLPRIVAFSFSIALLLAACGGAADAPVPAQPRLLASGLQLAPASMVLAGERVAYVVSKTGAAFAMANQADGKAVDLPGQVMRVHFADQSLALDIDKAPGQLYRLYRAAFDRTPDLGGMGYWLNALDQGFPLDQVAQQFIASTEFLALYGAADDAVFLGKLYAHVLHRAPDPGGLAYWLGILKAGATRTSVLVAFSESPENIVAVAPAIELGIAYADAGHAYRPFANAGANQSVLVGSRVELDGAASWDANGDILHYSWMLTGPAGSRATLSSASVAKPVFTADISGVYVGALTVGDGRESSSISTTYVIATPAVVLPVADSGRFKCSEISHSLALSLFAAGHTYLDRDHDGKACEATDMRLELNPPVVTPPVVIPPVVVPPVATPPVVVPPSTGPKQCWVNGYRRKNGTYVSGYWRSC
jgi:hypothetical protein